MTGFIGCLIASPNKDSASAAGASSINLGTRHSELVFYYPSQLKRWLAHLVDPSSAEITNPLGGLAELFQVLDQPVLNLLTQVNSPLTTISLIANLPSKPRRVQ